MHAVRKTDNLGGTHRKLIGLRAAWAAFNSNDITTTERRVKSGKFSLIEISLSKDLHLSTITFKINKDERGTSTTNGHDTTSERDSHVFNEFVSLFDSLVVLLPELIDTVSASELVRVGVDVLVA